MHGSVSPSKYGRLPSVFHVRFAFTRAIAVRARLFDGSTPILRKRSRASIEIIQPSSFGPLHQPSGAWRSSNVRPQPSRATRDRSAATTSSGSFVRSRTTCQRIAGSPSKPPHDARLTTAPCHLSGGAQRRSRTRAGCHPERSAAESKGRHRSFACASRARAIAALSIGPSTSIVKCPILRRATAWRLP